MAQGSPERLDTGGRVLGWVGVVAAGAGVVLYLSEVRGPDPYPVQLLSGSVFAGVLFWVVILRPRVRATAETLELRNMVDTVRIPFAAVEDHALRQVLAVRAGGRKYVATGVGRSARAAAGLRRGGPSRPPAGGGRGQVVDVADFVAARIAHLAGEARERAGIVRHSEEQRVLGSAVRREPAWVVVGVLVVTLALFVATLWL